jgi:hypothetical protein
MAVAKSLDQTVSPQMLPHKRLKRKYQFEVTALLQSTGQSGVSPVRATGRYRPRPFRTEARHANVGSAHPAGATLHPEFQYTEMICVARTVPVPNHRGNR